MKFLLLIVALFVVASMGDHLQCRQGEIDFYNYTTTIYAVGRAKKYITINAMVGTGCRGMSREKDADVMVMVMEVTNVKVIHDGEHPSKQEFDKSYELPITFLQKRNGEILRIIHDVKETPQILSIKKSMLTNFQVKLAGQTSTETTQAGTIQYLYEKAITKDGRDVIKKRGLRTLVTPDPRAKKRDAKHTSVAYIQVNPDGKIHKVYAEEGAHVGEPSARRHAIYEREKLKVKQEEHDPNYKKDENAANAMNFESTSVMDFISNGKYDDKTNSVKLSDSAATMEVADALSFNDNHKTTTLAMDKELIEAGDRWAKDRIVSSVDFPKILSSMKENPRDSHLLSRAHEYVFHAGDESLEHVVNEYKKLDLNNKEHLDYALSLQSIYTVLQSEKGTEQLISTMDHPSTVQQAIMNSLSINKPTDKLLETLKTLSTKKIDGLHEDENDDINVNAYLAYAHTAGKMDQDKQLTVLQEVVAKLEAARDVTEFEQQVHALGNMGSATPLEIISVLSKTEGLPLEVRLAAIKSLGNRIDEDEHEDVTGLLHELVHDKFHEGARVAAVNALTDRESEMQNAASLEFLSQHLDHSDSPVSLVHAIRDYCLEAETEESHMLLDRHEAITLGKHFAENEENVLFFRRLRRAFRRIGRKIKKGFKKVGQHFKKVGQKIKKGLVKIGKAIAAGAKKLYNATIGKVVGAVKGFIAKLKRDFSKAQFKGEKVCTKVNREGGQMCLYDQDMVTFVRRQGDLSMMKWSRQFAFERLIGVEIMHLYIGFLGYAGTRIDCETNSFDIAVFGRGEVKGRLFNRKLNILAAEIELQKRTNQNLQDRAYLRILGRVIYNKQFVPDRIRQLVNMCEKTSRPLMKPVKKTFLQFKFQIVAVVVPLTFSISVSGELGVNLVNIICPGRLTLTASVEPYAEASISAYGAIGFALLSGGVRVDFSARYTLQPGIGTSNCNLCAVLDHEVRPIAISIHLQAKAFTKKWSVQLYRYDGPVIRGNLFKFCLFPGRKYDPESALNGELPAPPRMPSHDSNPNPQHQHPVRPAPKPGKRPMPKRPVGRPTKRPTGRPSGRPGKRPSGRPNHRPTKRPTGKPGKRPTRRPTKRPTGRPTKRPIGRPGKRPTGRPNRRPTKRPVGKPARPVKRPIGKPNRKPTKRPNRRPRPTKRPYQPVQQQAPQEAPQQQFAAPQGQAYQPYAPQAPVSAPVYQQQPSRFEAPPQQFAPQGSYQPQPQFAPQQEPQYIPQQPQYVPQAEPQYIPPQPQYVPQYVAPMPMPMFEAPVDIPTHQELSQVINQKLPEASQVDECHQHLEKIHRVVSKCIPDVQRQVARRSQCCSARQPCCNHPIVHQESGVEYHHLMRKLARKERALTRRIERRRQISRQFRRNREAVRRSFDRLTNLLEQ